MGKNEDAGRKALRRRRERFTEIIRAGLIEAGVSDERDFHEARF
jgi:hypothetical protein